MRAFLTQISGNGFLSLWDRYLAWRTFTGGHFCLDLPVGQKYGSLGGVRSVEKQKATLLSADKQVLTPYAEGMQRDAVNQVDLVSNTGGMAKYAARETRRTAAHTNTVPLS